MSGPDEELINTQREKRRVNGRFYDGNLIIKMSIREPTFGCVIHRRL